MSLIGYFLHEIPPTFAVDDMDDFSISDSDSSSSEDSSIKLGGSRIGRSANNARDYAEAHECIYKAYFAESPVYDSKLFQRRFRMRRSLFLKIIAVVKDHDDYFQQKKNAIGELGLST